MKVKMIMKLLATPKKEPTTGDECFVKGKGYLNKGSSEKAMECFRIGAERFNDSDCQYALGKHYIFGNIEENPNIELALYWLKKAANQGINSYRLFFLLGIIHLGGGEGMIADEKEASFWIEKAALFDNDCYEAIGKGYYEGEFIVADGLRGLTIKKNYKKALEFYIEAFRKSPDDNKIHQKIARIYSEGGYGVEKDTEKAQFWSEKSLKKR